MQNYYGSLCLSDIPKDLIEEVNGKKYLNISVVEVKSSPYGDSHFIAASCKKEERKDGVKYIFGNLKPSSNDAPSREQIDNAPPVENPDDLPF